MPSKWKMTKGPWICILNPKGCIRGTEELFRVVSESRSPSGIPVFTAIAENLDEGDARAIACLPELVEEARTLCMNVDAMQLKPTIVSTAALRRILARIDGSDNAE